MALPSFREVIRDFAIIFLHSPSKAMFDGCECPGCRASTVRALNKLRTRAAGLAKVARRRGRELRARDLAGARRNQRRSGLSTAELTEDVIRGLVRGLS